VVAVGVSGCALGLVVVGVGVGVEVAVWVVVVVGVPEAVSEDVAVAVSVDVDVCVPFADDPGEEKIAGTLDDEGPVQAETAAETTTIKVAQLRMVSRALPAVPGMVIRAFMKPP
jgi:hypothetical protein